MIAISRINTCWRIVGAILGLSAMWGVYAVLRPVDEVVLTIGESYEHVRQQSRSTLPAVTPYNIFCPYVRRPATLRFSDPQYGFTTPAAKFLAICADMNGKVEQLTLSPQVETLPLDETMAILVDLQNQLRRGGWRPTLVVDNPLVVDTPATRAEIRNFGIRQTFWLASDKYQAFLSVRRFVHENRPNDERYLITLQLSGPPFLVDLSGG